MAESWIKMRGSLVTNPRVIRMARLLLDDPEFLEWYGATAEAVKASSSVTMRHVTVVTRVTVGALLPLWSGVNECAGDDGLLRGATLFEVDAMAGVPGLGRAMQAVEWLEVEEGVGIHLPNFKEHNTVEKQRKTGAKTDAERQRDHRARKAQQLAEGGPDSSDPDGDDVTGSVTEKRDKSRDSVTTEKRREEKTKEPNGSVGSLPACQSQAVVDLYHEVLPELPRCRLMPEKRKAAISKFWRWVLTTCKGDGSRRAQTADEALGWLRDYFDRARENDFLMGRTQRHGEHANWQCDLDFLLTDRGMKHVIEKTSVTATEAA